MRLNVVDCVAIDTDDGCQTRSDTTGITTTASELYATVMMTELLPTVVAGPATNVQPVSEPAPALLVAEHVPTFPVVPTL